MNASVFHGPERVAVFAPLARPMRMGRAAARGETDRAAVAAALQAGRLEAARALMAAVVGEHAELLAILAEWARQMPRTLAAREGEAVAAETVGRAWARWRERTSGDRTGTGALGAAAHTEVERWLGGVEGVEVAAGLVGEWRRRGEAVMVAVEAAGAAGVEALRAWEDYLAAIRTGHDALVEWLDELPAATLARRGQAAAEALVRESFGACTFFEPLWAVGQLPPADIAAFLAAHIRAHLSGEARGGGVEVVEEPDRFRLIFDACGSGGAMRRRRATGAVKLPEASSATWMRAGEVPPYCAHCAFNELESVRRWGYPKLVTEFDPDPLKPCGWTIYKQADAIPARYYLRLGLKAPGVSAS